MKKKNYIWYKSINLYFYLSTFNILYLKNPSEVGKVTTAMSYLIKSYGLDCRMSVTIHDEVRFLVGDSDKWRAALALQISNLWTRCYFVASLGINDLPLSVAFFSAFDVDRVLRKEPSLPCITPSSLEPIEPGESIDIYQLLQKVNSLGSPSKSKKDFHVRNEELDKYPVRSVQRADYLRKQLGVPDSNPMNSDNLEQEVKSSNDNDKMYTNKTTKNESFLIQNVQIIELGLLYYRGFT
jgi:hypothetical protein